MGTPQHEAPKEDTTPHPEGPQSVAAADRSCDDVPDALRAPLNPDEQRAARIRVVQAALGSLLDTAAGIPPLPPRPESE